MIITCEKCNANYMVSTSSLGERGRSVKCAKCQHTWFAKPTQQEIEKIKQTPPIEEKIKSGIKLPTINEPRVPLALKILPIILIILILCLSFILFYKPIIKIFPNTHAMYELFGIHNHEGVVFKDISIIKSDIKNSNNLILTGEIENISDSNKIIPDLRFTIIDKLGTTILIHTIKSNKKTLLPGEKYSISNTIRNLQKRSEILELDIGNKIDLMLR